MWTAQFIAANGALSHPLVAGPIFPSWLAIAAVASPLAEYALIRYVSGVPILEVSPAFLFYVNCSDEVIGLGRQEVR